MRIFRTWFVSLSRCEFRVYEPQSFAFRHSKDPNVLLKIPHNNSVLHPGTLQSQSPTFSPQTLNPLSPVTLSYREAASNVPNPRPRRLSVDYHTHFLQRIPHDCGNGACDWPNQLSPNSICSYSSFLFINSRPCRETSLWSLHISLFPCFSDLMQPCPV